MVGALVTHVGSGFPNEADSSLDVLSDLVEHHPSHMSSFAIFLKVRFKRQFNLLIKLKCNKIGATCTKI